MTSLLKFVIKKTTRWLTRRIEVNDLEIAKFTPRSPPHQVQNATKYASTWPNWNKANNNQYCSDTYHLSKYQFFSISCLNQTLPTQFSIHSSNMRLSSSHNLFAAIEWTQVRRLLTPCSPKLFHYFVGFNCSVSHALKLSLFPTRAAYLALYCNTTTTVAEIIWIAVNEVHCRWKCCASKSTVHGVVECATNLIILRHLISVVGLRITHSSHKAEL